MQYKRLCGLLVYIYILNYYYIHANDVEKCSKICDEYGGICEGDICKCRDNYTTLPSHNNYKFCNYERKRGVYTAFLELLIGFGMGHFYCGRKINACLKLLLFFFLCCTCYCSLAVVAKLQEERTSHSHLVTIFYYVFGCISNTIIIWQVYDFVMFLFGVYTDGNDIPLY